jgi:saccharopine dehydrogenase-like NADP-dependent oxidoreductase
MNIVILGGGQQGRVIATDLARALPEARIEVADIRRPALPALDNLSWVEADCSEPSAAARLMAAHDLAVGALPARFGFGTMQAAIEAQRPLVDVSFSAENPLELDAAAREAGVAIIPDCGLAPGLSHLAAGHASTQGPLAELVIYVGGVAQDASRPYGYVVTWSLDDLLEEYVRPARIVRDGATVSLPVFSEVERVQVDGAGEMEAFLSDGLRTAIDTFPGVPNMEERTLRWPGHVEQVRPLVESGRFLEEFRARCVVDEPRDLVALVVRVRWQDGRRERMTLVDRWDEATKQTAMSRTTALTTAVTAQLVAKGGAREAGVHPLEHVGRDETAYRFIIDQLATRGVRMAWREE